MCDAMAADGFVPRARRSEDDQRRDQSTEHGRDLACMPSRALAAPSALLRSGSSSSPSPSPSTSADFRCSIPTKGATPRWGARWRRRTTTSCRASTALPYLDKPIVYFAAEAAAMEVLGPTETRGATAGVSLHAGHARRSSGGSRGGVWGERRGVHRRDRLSGDAADGRVLAHGDLRQRAGVLHARWRWRFSICVRGQGAREWSALAWAADRPRRDHERSGGDRAAAARGDSVRDLAQALSRALVVARAGALRRS